MDVGAGRHEEQIFGLRGMSGGKREIMIFTLGFSQFDNKERNPTLI